MTKKFRRFKKRKTRINKISDKSYNWIPTYNPASPAISSQVSIGKIVEYN